MKRILTILIAVFILFNCITTCLAAESLSNEEYRWLENELKEYNKVKNNLHQQANNLRALGYHDESSDIIALKTVWLYNDEKYQETKETYLNKYIYNDDFWLEAIEEYPTATYVWRYLKGLMYSDAVCAGIIGNMMAETSGGTLNLNWDIYDASGYYYGLCQWNKGSFPKVFGKDVKGQMDILRDTIKYQIDYAGFVYGGKGFDYEDFLEISDPGEAALCFAKAYERCAAQHVAPRAKYAKIAYDYFVK